MLFTATGWSCGKPHSTTVSTKHGRVATNGEAKVMSAHLLALSQWRQQRHAVLCPGTGSRILHSTKTTCYFYQTETEQERHRMVKYR